MFIWSDFDGFGSVCFQSWHSSTAFEQASGRRFSHGFCDGSHLSTSFFTVSDLHRGRTKVKVMHKKWRSSGHSNSGAIMLLYYESILVKIYHQLISARNNTGR